MANRRFGGAAGPQRGGINRNFNSSSNISPWQGGAPPGNANNNIQNQLALALTSLIQQTSQQQTSDGPPSLLNMNTSPGFYNQDQFNNQNRFGNRGRQDFRRPPEPYNKNNRVGGQWRSDNANNRNTKRGVGNFQSKNRSNFRNNKTPVKDQSKNDKKSNDKSPKQEKTTENSADDRDDKEVKDEEKTDGTPKATSYDGLPNGLLHCFVCNKSMWDGESFQNHLGGKAHKQMINSLEESFQITVNILRENMRLCEERKMIEYERMQRSRRYHHNNVQEPESHCNMCDLKFMGKIVVHRQTEGHQRLKRFLHPKCKRCNLEFPSRMEWVDHQFSHEHLFKLKEYFDSKDLAAGEYRVKVPVETDNEPLLEETVQNEDESPVLELSEDLNNLFNRIPIYKSDRAVSKESVVAAEGSICDLCNYFMPSEEESQNHLKSYYHYQNFVEAVKLKYQKAANEKKRKAEEETPADGEETEEAGEAEVKEEDENKDDEEMDKLLNDLYDPFVLDDGEEKEEEAQAEEEEEEEEEKKEEEKVEVKVEEKKPEVDDKKPAVTVATPATPNTRGKRGAVKNGAGPKSKKVKN